MADFCTILTNLRHIHILLFIIWEKRNTMINVYKTLEFDVIIDQLKNYCLTEQAKKILII